MSRIETNKKHPALRVLIVLLLILFTAAAVFAFWLRREINNTEVLRSYRITYSESAGESAALLKQLCKDRLSVRLFPATSHSHLYLHLICTEEEAESHGFSLAALNDGGFLIARQGNGLYLLAKSQTGLSRACCYLTFRLTDEKGGLLIRQDERYLDTGSNLKEIFGPGGVPMSEYTVVCPKGTSSNAAWELCCYINQSCGVLPGISEKEDTVDTPYILLSLEASPAGSPHSISFSDSNIAIKGDNEKELAAAIHEFANMYLGWMFAGTAREGLSAGNTSIRLPDRYDAPPNESWIPEREAIITLWQVNYSRGIYLNDSTSLKTNILSFSDEQLYDYVRMLKFCGFTGIQATDMCSAWAGAGGYEFVHERLRILADAAHSLGMNFTLWVWGAEFTGYGWVDNSVTYIPDGYDYSQENPDVVATFEKYYSIYAELADCCDRVIAHFFDPGNLYLSEDVAYFSRLLSEKFLAVNPNIDFGVSCWVDTFNKKDFIDALGTDITLYEGTHHDDKEEYASFRSFCRDMGCRLGTWAWNTCEMEIDQLAQMNFNPHIIQDVYLTASQYDDIDRPDYWSEMDSNHVVNVFSLYCAGQLLMDPARDLDELTEEIALAAVGAEYAEDFADVLRLLEDARSGESWNTYWWNSEDYLLKSADYPAEEILERSEQALTLLAEMIDKRIEANTLPLPIELPELLQLMLPQIEQINAFAKFRIGLADASQLLTGGAAREDIQARLEAISTPVSEYNTVTGLWGQIEARAQQEMLLDFCNANGFDMPWDPVFRQTRKNRIYDYFVSYQKGHSEPVLQFAPYFQYGLAYGEETTVQLVNELLEEGLFSKDPETGGIYLTDWEHYKYAFNFIY